MPPSEDGTRVRAKILRMVKDHKDRVGKDINQMPEMIKFKCLIDNEYEDVIAYNDIVDYIKQDDGWDGTWKFRKILRHKGPLKSNDKRYKGSSYNLLVEWESGEWSWEPLHTKDKTGVFDTDPVTVGIYAYEKGLVGKKGWNFPYLKQIAKTQRRIIRRANQAKLQSFRHKPIYMYGYLVP